VINRRQSLLSLRVTKFAEVYKIQSEIKLFVQLWTISDKFRINFPLWMEGNFDLLDAEEIEESILDWWKSLNRLSKSRISDYYHPMNLLNYLYGQLEEFKEYLPMIIALRTKGITERHWQILSGMFNIQLDPSTVTVRSLLAQKLYEPDKLSKIKGVSDIAVKEYAIQTTLENLENEIRAAEFTTLKYKDTNTHILRGTDELISQFEEFSIKIAALRANQLSKNFNERVTKVEKDIKIVEDVLEEWTKCQKSWMYLEPIFQSEDISKQMPAESQSFQLLDQFYRATMKTFVQDPSVIRAAKRDGLYFQLIK
jgi:dynein heavy chain